MTALRCIALALLAAAAAVQAAEPATELADPALSARYEALTRELRCLVCQNQTIADSHATLAKDLRREVREQLERGATDAEVIAFMTERYGDYVLYRPPLTAATVLLWSGPFLVLAVALAVWWRGVQRRAATGLPGGDA